MSSLRSRILKDVTAEWLDIVDNAHLGKIIQYFEHNPIELADVTPPLELWLEFARVTPYYDVKIVILGQDPYPKAGDAHGLSFSYTGALPVPKSLSNIYKCLMNQKIMVDEPVTGNLTGWAQQGVLLLNTALTTRINHAKSHSKLWMQYTVQLIVDICYSMSPIFILWGNEAAKLERFIIATNAILVEDSSVAKTSSVIKNNVARLKETSSIAESNVAQSQVLKWSHPSPLAQMSKDPDAMQKHFINCTNFAEANEILRLMGEAPINWDCFASDPLEIHFKADLDTHVIFTDGSCWPNKKISTARAGYAAYFAYGVCKNTLLIGNIDIAVAFATNQRAEGEAIYQTLNYVYEADPKAKRIIVITDSEFWINTITKWLPNWISRGLLESKANPDLNKKIWDIYSKNKERGASIEFFHVNSHNKSGWNAEPKNSFKYCCYKWNDFVDRAAGDARTKMTPGEHCHKIA